MKRAACLAVVFTGLAAAETFSGTVVDVMCRGKDLAGHTRECAIQCSRGGYGLVTAEGKFLKFDEGGNARVLALLKKSVKEKDLKAKVTGTAEGDVIRVDAVELQ